MGVLDENRGEIEKMLAGGASASVVGDRYGVTRNTVIGWMTRRQIENRRKPTAPRPITRPISPHERLARDAAWVLEEFRKAAFKPAAIRALSARYGVPQRDMRAWLADHGAEGVPAGPEPQRGAPKQPMAGTLPVFKPPRRKGKLFLDAGREDCKFPLWGNDESTGFVCAQPVAQRTRGGQTATLSWCEDCLKIVSQKPVKLAARERKTRSVYALRTV
jgi:hypothetical protein